MSDESAVACSALLAANCPNSMAEDGQMLDRLLEVQRILTRNRDHARLSLLYPLTDSLQHEYLLHLKRVNELRTVSLTDDRP